MSLRNPGSFELNLTVNARKEFNETIRHYGAFLSYFETEAAARNISSSTRNDAVTYAHTERDGLDPSQFTRGLYSTKGADEVREHWWNRFDHYEFYRLVHEDLLPLADLEAVLAEARASEESAQADATSARQTGSRAVPGERTRTTAAPQNTAAEKPFEAAARVVLGGFEPLRMPGHIMSLVFDQPHVRRWLSDTADLGSAFGPTRREAGGSATLASLSAQPEVAPTLAGYLGLLEEVVEDTSLLTVLLGPQYVDRRRKLLDRIRRARLVLVLLLGHASDLVPKEFPGLVEQYVPFTLPRRVVVAPKLLADLLESAAITDLSGLRLSDEYVSLLLGDGLSADPAPLTQDQKARLIAEFVVQLGDDTHKVFTFVCRGPSGRSAERAREQAFAAPPRSYAPDEPDYCGWYPKPDETHPVVFIGSPGTSKSTLMLTGLLQFYNNAQALGATVGFQSDKDLREYDNYVDRYWEGALPDPTPAGSRNSIQLRVESTTDPTRGANFVFTDVPGEVTSRSVRGEGADPIVLGVLKHAETVVFLFDLSIEQAVQRQLANSPAQESWAALQRNADKVMKERLPSQDSGAAPGRSDTAPSAALRSRARVSQLDLLERMISDLREIRGHDLRTGGPNFICIVPKTDLYVASVADDRDPRESRIKFLTKFYDWLIDQRILSPTANGPDLESSRSPSGAIEWYRSAAVYGWLGSSGQGEVGGPMARQTIHRQLELVRNVSDQAREALETIGEALGPAASEAEGEARGDGASEADVRSLSDLVRARLIERLQSVFRSEDVYFLPISAQGSDVPDVIPSSDEAPLEGRSQEARSQQRGLGYPPNAKLSQYAFMLPVLLSLRGMDNGAV
ncbi:hypothetical protein [Streptomyces sp. S.PB5]|uniref:hypothetical protein n=1 Tax=Streptomyces sp. S.PB5 TaxID=3020844 RepID=UPI0025B1579C|nr:hypothetical protein [Streptomyces sp. S.PB5]MDN3028251.1 hypothetical protein [Streptomyces sp. S.PB5]